MIMRYKILKNHPKVFLSVTGLRVSEFDMLCNDVLDQFMEAEQQRLERPDRQRVGPENHRHWRLATKSC